MQRIGILGGTFNPIHNAHLELAQQALKKYHLSKVLFIPNSHPPHKPVEGLTSATDRYNMAELTLAGHAGFILSRAELNRRGKSYAVDTVKILETEYPRAFFFYIMGVDAINDILSWKKPLELFDRCEFIIATRPGANTRQFKRILRFPILEKYRHKIHMLEFKNETSSTEIRRRLKKGLPVTDMVPESVLKYIKLYKLYSPNKGVFEQ